MAPSFAPSEFLPPSSSLSLSNAAKNVRMAEAFAPKKKLPPLNNTLQFPTPSLATVVVFFFFFFFFFFGSEEGDPPSLPPPRALRPGGRPAQLMNAEEANTQIR